MQVLKVWRKLPKPQLVACSIYFSGELVVVHGGGGACEY